MWRFNRKNVPEDSTPLIDPAVEEAKYRFHVAAEKAKQEADRLNQQFSENHITLTILRTMGGAKRGR